MPPSTPDRAVSAARRKIHYKGRVIKNRPGLPPDERDPAGGLFLITLLHRALPEVGPAQL